MQENGQAALVCEQKPEFFCQKRASPGPHNRKRIRDEAVPGSGTSRIFLEFLFCLFIRNLLRAWRKGKGDLQDYYPWKLYC